MSDGEIISKISNGKTSVEPNDSLECAEKKEVEGKSYYAYILRCADGSLYSGYTDDLNKRLAVHNSGKGAKYTRSRLPVAVVYRECFATKSEAMSREFHIKKLSRQEKLALIGNLVQ